MDVTDRENISSLVNELTTIYKIDLILNNGGYGLNVSLESLMEEQIVKQMDTILLGVIAVTKAFIPYFRNRE